MSLSLRSIILRCAASSTRSCRSMSESARATATWRSGCSLSASAAPRSLSSFSGTCLVRGIETVCERKAFAWRQRRGEPEQTIHRSGRHRETVIAGTGGVRHDRRNLHVDRHIERGARTGDQGAPLLRFRGAKKCCAKRDFPFPAWRDRRAERSITSLRKLQPAAIGRSPYRYQWHARLLDEGSKRVDDRGLPGGPGERTEEILGGCIAMRVREQVLVNAALKHFLSQVRLEHRQHAAALIVSDRVESAGDACVVSRSIRESAGRRAASRHSSPPEHRRSAKCAGRDPGAIDQRS